MELTGTACREHLWQALFLCTDFIVLVKKSDCNVAVYAIVRFVIQKEWEFCCKA